MYYIKQEEEKKNVHKWTKYVQMLLIPTIDIHFNHIGIYTYVWIAWNQQHIFHHWTFYVYRTKFWDQIIFIVIAKATTGFALLWQYNFWFLIISHNKRKIVQLFPFLFSFFLYNKECLVLLWNISYGFSCRLHTTLRTLFSIVHLSRMYICKLKIFTAHANVIFARCNSNEWLSISFWVSFRATDCQSILKFFTENFISTTILLYTIRLRVNFSDRENE